MHLSFIPINTKLIQLTILPRMMRICNKRKKYGLANKHKILLLQFQVHLSYLYIIIVGALMDAYYMYAWETHMRLAKCKLYMDRSSAHYG